MVTKVIRVFIFIGQNHPSLDETRFSLVNIDSLLINLIYLSN